jgi:hypothetical protein
VTIVLPRAKPVCTVDERSEHAMTGEAPGISRRRALTSLGAGTAAVAAAAAGLGGGIPVGAVATDDPNQGDAQPPATGSITGTLVESHVPTVPGVSYVGINYARFFPYSDSSAKQVQPGAGTYATGGGSLIAPLDVPHGSMLYDITGWGGAGSAVQVRRAMYGTYTWDTLTTLTLPAGAGIVSSNQRFMVGAVPTLIPVDLTHASYHVQLTAGTPATALLDLRIGYVGPRGFTAIVPTRVYDSREPGAGGHLASGTTRDVSVANAIPAFGGTNNVVPAGAAAIAYNLTIADTNGSGFLAVYNQGGAFSASAINWFGSGQLLANAGIVSLGGDRMVTVQCGGGGSTNFLIDVTGYFV